VNKSEFLHGCIGLVTSDGTYEKELIWLDLVKFGFGCLGSEGEGGWGAWTHLGQVAQC
jgi:hypothetical protein